MGKLEQRYPHELVIIGVASPKYPAEGVADNLRHAVQRLHIEHPVVSDPDHVVWDSYAVNAWPTLVFISPQGEVLGANAGEVPFEALDQVVGEIVQEYDREGALSRVTLDLQVTAPSRPADTLSFPGKVLVAEDHLFIADSGHHRMLIADQAGRVEEIVGDGQPGFADGGYAEAQFDSPQGMALSPDGMLYLADAENHTIRVIDLDRRRVSTVAGNGEQAYRLRRAGPAREISLSSPYDVAVEGQSIYIAMAGLHQIWRLDLAAGTAGVWAGTGHEGIRDGNVQNAWFAQPMDLSLSDDVLYVSCGETQVIRAIDIPRGTVSTIAGRGLFEFGDVDGPAEVALLQHNQGVAAAGDTLYVADTYNNRIRAIDLATATVTSPYGSGQVGMLDGPGRNARFDEPAGIYLAGNTLYVADTNNHSIRTVDIASGHVRTLDISGLPA